MPNITVGYRKLYDAVGCSLSDRKELEISFVLDKYRRGELRLGPKPRFGISVIKGDKYAVPGQQSTFMKLERLADATETSYPRKFFLEIACFKEVEVSADLYQKYHAHDKEAEQQLVSLAETKRTELSNAIDMLAGTVYLKFHRQFVLELINENVVVIKGSTDYSYSEHGPVVELMEAIALNANGVIGLEHMLNTIGQTDPQWQDLATTVFQWLLRASTERDSVTKFVSLFIPLEIVLAGYGDGLQKELSEQANEIRELIRQHSKNSEQQSQFLDKLMEKQRPSLAARFEMLATKARLTGWGIDIEAFKRFNKMRNRLLHKGEQNVRLVVEEPQKEEVYSLEDLVERYVSYVLFGDAVVYQSRWRPVRPS